MKSNRILLACLTAVFALTLPLNVQAGWPRNSKKKEPPKPQYQAIDAVDATAKTITVSYRNTPSANAKTLKINERTEIQVNGNKATINDLHSGMKVVVGVGMDPTIAASLSASPAPPDPKRSK
jgi:hypothetical protein